jgi:hypothetical protein
VSNPADEKHLARRRDAEGKWQIAPTWESLIDRQIREAMEEGKFDELPHQGAPLPLDENPYAGDMGLAFHMLKNAGVAPPWIEANKELADLLAQRDSMLARAATGPAPTSMARTKLRAQLRELVRQANIAIAKVNAESPAHSLHQLPLDMDDELARFDAACRR